MLSPAVRRRTIEKKSLFLMVRFTYTAKGKLTEGSRASLTRQMFGELFQARELIWRLFLRDFRSKYRQSALGISWAIIMPVVTVGMFVLMNRSGVLKVQDVGVPYPMYAMLGVTIWSVFSVGLAACTGALVNAGSMVVKINFPKVALVMAASGQSIVEFLVRSALVFLLVLYYKIPIHLSSLFIGLLCLVPIYLLAVGFGFVLSLAAGVLRDILNIINLGLMGLMLLTPVLYPLRGDSLLAYANQWNPFMYLVNAPRELLVQGHTELASGFLLSAALAITLFYIGWRLFYLAQGKIAERI